MTSVFLTLAKGQGHTSRPKAIDVEVSAFSDCFLLFPYYHIICIICICVQLKEWLVCVGMYVCVFNNINHLKNLQQNAYEESLDATIPSKVLGLYQYNSYPPKCDPLYAPIDQSSTMTVWQ